MELLRGFWDTNGPTVVRSLVVIVVGALVWKVATAVVREALLRTARGEDPDAIHRRQRIETLWVTMRRIAFILYVAILAVVVAQLWGFPVASLTAIGAAAGFAFGFGAQSLVKDLIAGFFILAEDQFRIGDVVRVGGVSGTVEDIQLRVTVLRDLDSNLHYVPNGMIDVTSNLTPDRARPVIDVGISYDADIDRALEVFGEELDRFAHEHGWEDLVIGEPEILGVQALGDSSVVLRGAITVLPEARWKVYRELLRRVKKRFDAEGIEIPFPQRTLTLGDDELRARLLARLGASDGQEGPSEGDAG